MAMPPVHAGMAHIIRQDFALTEDRPCAMYW
jgi:hypothetical protein